MAKKKKEIERLDGTTGSLQINLSEKRVAQRSVQHFSVQMWRVIKSATRAQGVLCNFRINIQFRAWCLQLLNYSNVLLLCAWVWWGYGSCRAYKLIYYVSIWKNGRRHRLGKHKHWCQATKQDVCSCAEFEPERLYRTNGNRVDCSTCYLRMILQSVCGEIFLQKSYLHAWRSLHVTRLTNLNNSTHVSKLLEIWWSTILVYTHEKITKTYQRWDLF